ncbi:MAG TPA: asparagine--tRNA ligase [Flavobacteriales bacterium]|nr:asparagine--tRNA ligase [Flavobacteriales bacterium]HMR26171.1 asparagine--tRNA ligase [Flavobacteriales bacterium]
MEPTPIKSVLDDTALTGTTLTVAGWVRTFRNDRFIALNDGSTIRNLQCVIDQGKVDAAARARFTTSAAVKCTGLIVESKGSGQRVEMQVTAVEVLGDSDGEKYPIQPKKHSLEFLRENAHLRFRTNTYSAIFRIRHQVSFGIHEYFDSLGYNYFHSPIITASDAEGAGEMFRVSTLDAKNPPLNEDGSVNWKEDFFGAESRLTVSGQLQAELSALALGKVYTFGPTFRAENSNTARHLAEFWMIEPEAAFMDLAGDMDLAEGLCKHLIARVLKNSMDDLQFLDARLKEEEAQKPKEQRSELGLIDRLKFVLDNPFERITYTDAIEILLRSKPHQKKQFQFPVEWGIDLQSEHERYLVEKHFKKPVIVTGYPGKIKAFYMRTNGPGDFGYSDKGTTVAAMDVLFPGIGEIIGGSQREERLDVLEARMKDMGVDEKELWWYLDTRRFGTVPHAGFGLGLERFVLFVTGMGNIRDVIPFPRTPKSAEF